jgi:CPA1 family monovalent cation:H+ antiporter
LFLLPFASYLIAEHIGFSGILAAVAAGMTITRSGVMRSAPLAMRRANSTWAMLEFVFNGMVFLLLGLQLPGILESRWRRRKLIRMSKPGCCSPISC